jgi:hypothetical protein
MGSTELELINKKTVDDLFVTHQVKIPLIANNKYKISDSILIYLNEDNDSYLFKKDSVLIKVSKSTQINPLFNIGELVYYESDIYQIKNINEKYIYTIYKEIGNNKMISINTNANNLKKLPVSIILEKFSSRKISDKSESDLAKRSGLTNILIDSSLTSSNDVSLLVESTISKHMKSSYVCKCCYDDHNSYNLITSLKAINLKPDYKYILINRYIKSLVYHENQITQVNGIYHSFRFFIQTGSILTPALLSIEHLVGGNHPNFIYWITWVISLMVGLLTNYISLFGLDKKFFTYEKNYHILVSHGWQYVQLSGKYGAKKDSIELPTHETMFTKFCNNIETLLLNEATSITQSIKDKSEPAPKTPRLKTTKSKSHDNNFHVKNK